MNQLNKFSGIAHWLPRLSLAATFLYHAFPKIAMTGKVSSAMGMPFIMVLALGLIEALGALFILYGGFGPEWATRLGGLIFTVIMVGAIVMVHAQYGWNSINMGNNGGRGMEFQVLIATVSLLYAFKGNAINEKVETDT